VTTDHLTATLRACAAGLCPLEAGVAPFASNGTFLRRHDFSTIIGIDGRNVDLLITTVRHMVRNSSLP